MRKHQFQRNYRFSVCMNKIGDWKKGSLFFLLFFLGFFIGIIGLNLIGGKYIEEMGMVSSYYVVQFEAKEIIYGELFLYLLQRRLTTVALLALLGITAIGSAVIYGFVIWFGVTAGCLFTAGVLQYGMKGRLLCVGGIMPQYLVYVPAVAWLLYNCLKKKREGRKQQDNSWLLSYFLIFIISIGFVFLGVIMESYLNPLMLSWILTVF